MPLKLTIAKLEEVDEKLRDLYTEKDGAFHLQLEGEHPDVATHRAKVVEFRDANIALNTELRTAKEALKPFTDLKLTVEDVQALQTKVTEFEKKGVKKPDDVSQAIQDAVAAAVNPLTEKLTAVETQLTSERTRADESEMKRQITQAAVKAGVRDTAIDDLLFRARDTFEVKDGAIAAKAGRFSTDQPSQPLGVDEWLTQLSTKDAPHLFKTSTGTGAEHESGPGPGGKVLNNPSATEFGANLEDIAKGKTQVKTE